MNNFLIVKYSNSSFVALALLLKYDILTKVRDLDI